MVENFSRGVLLSLELEVGEEGPAPAMNASKVE